MIYRELAIHHSIDVLHFLSGDLLSVARAYHHKFHTPLHLRGLQCSVLQRCLCLSEILRVPRAQLFEGIMLQHEYVVEYLMQFLLQRNLFKAKRG